MRDVFDVINEIHTESVAVGFSGPEAAACTKRVLAKCRNTKNHSMWRAVAACVAGLAILSGGVAYAYSEGFLQRLFAKIAPETISTQVIDEDYVTGEYQGPVDIETNYPGLLDIDVKKVAVGYNTASVVLLVDYPEFDTDMYSSYDFTTSLSKDGKPVWIGGTGCVFEAEELQGLESLKPNQKVYDLTFEIEPGAIAKGDAIELKIDGFELRKQASISDGSFISEMYTGDKEDAYWNVQVQVQDELPEMIIDCSGQEMVSFCLLNTREVIIKGDKNLVCGSMVTLNMKDGTKVVDVGGGVTFSADLDIASREAVFKVAADINQVDSIQIDSEEMGTVIIPVNK